MATPLYVLVHLWVRPGLEMQFEAYERTMARILGRHGGVIERVIRPLRTTLQGPEQPFEIHLLSFPRAELYEAYRNDPERSALGRERAAVIIDSEVIIGTQGPTYSHA